MNTPDPPLHASDPRSAAGDAGESSWVVFDLEFTTSGGPPHLVEVGAVRVRGGEVQDHFESLVAPPVPVDPASTALHGLRDEDLRAAPFAVEVLQRFFGWIGDAPLLAHNAPADGQVLGYECARHGLEPPPNPLFDSLALARRALPAAPDHQLSTLVEYLGLEHGVSHRALADAAACAQVVLHCLAAEGRGGDATPALLLGLGLPPRKLRSLLPARPTRRPAQLRVLERARAEGGAVTLLYGDLQTEPAPVQVQPRLLYRSGTRGYLEAECARSGLLKTYRLDRVQRVLPL